MSRELITVYRDDHDKSPSDETLEFTLLAGFGEFDGHHIGTDLTTAHADELRDLLRPWIEKAFLRKKVKTKAKASTPKAEREENRRIRAWAKAAGYDIGGTGQIPEPVRKAYAKEQVRPVSRHPGGGSMARAMAVTDPDERKAMREYAARQGRTLGKGLIPRDVQEAYRAERAATA